MQKRQKKANKKEAGLYFGNREILFKSYKLESCLIQM